MYNVTEGATAEQSTYLSSIPSISESPLLDTQLSVIMPVDRETLVARAKLAEVSKFTHSALNQLRLLTN